MSRRGRPRRRPRLFGAAVLLAGCASAPEETDERQRRRGLGLPPLHGLRRRRLRRQVVQPARLRGPRPRRPKSSASSPSPSSRLGDRLRAEHHEPRRPELHLIITVGFALAAADRRGRREPRHRVRLIDDVADNDFDGTTDAENIKPIIFDTAQAAFLAGYASADFTATEQVGTFGGMNFPTVSIFMDGFKQGVEYCNEQNGTRQGPRLGWHRRSLHRWLRRQRHGCARRRAGPRRPGRRRAPARRWPDLPERRMRPSATPAVRSRCSASTPTCYETDPIGRRPAAHLDPQGDRRRRPRGRARRRHRRLRPDAVRRHARERGRRPRAVPRLRVEGLARRCRPSSTRSQGRHHRRVDPGQVLPRGLVRRTRDRGGRATGLPDLRRASERASAQADSHGASDAAPH